MSAKSSPFSLRSIATAAALIAAGAAKFLESKSASASGGAGGMVVEAQFPFYEAFLNPQDPSYFFARAVLELAESEPEKKGVVNANTIAKANATVAAAAAAGAAASAAGAAGAAGAEQGGRGRRSKKQFKNKKTLRYGRRSIRYRI
jgi:hypothetical protein